MFTKEKNSTQTSGIIRKKKYEYDNEDEDEDKNNKGKKIASTVKTGFFNFFTRNSKKNVQARDYLDDLSCKPESNTGYDLDDYDKYEVGCAFDVALSAPYDCDDDYKEKNYKSDYDSYLTNSYKKNLSDTSNKKEEKKKEIKNDNNDDFDELIIAQDVIEGNWSNDSHTQALIKKEKDMYNKIKKEAESKGIKDENGIITIFILYYIYNTKREKLTELKFVIKKAKNYLAKKFNMEYDNIVQGI